jgi:transposase
MLIIGCDFHPKFQQIAYVDQESGEYGERRLNHPEEATQFYRSLAGSKVRIGLEAREFPLVPAFAGRAGA